MVIKSNECFEKTRQVENNNKSKKYILRGERNVTYHDRVLSNKKKSYNFDFISNSTYSYTFTNSHERSEASHRRAII